MNKAYWKESVIYEIYPRSFMDSDGDGVGDLAGLISKANYIQDLGVDTVWLTPIYASPNVDYGYDISDYYEIQPEYGTMDDFKRLVHEMHERGIRVLMDLVLNHTSDQHPWFQQSRSAADNPYRDYYIWRPANSDGGPPNNWTSYLGTPAWTWDDQAEQYYLHLYNARQPDLNWDYPPLRQQMYKMMRFWLELGIDGFRLDAINSLSKDQRFPDTNQEKLQANGDIFTKNGPHIHTYLQEMNEEVFSHYPIFTAGEASKVRNQDVLMYTHPARHEMNMILSPEAATLGRSREDEFQSQNWTLEDLRSVLSRWQKDIGEDGGWFGIYVSNHDQQRMVDTFGDPETYRVESAKMIATLLMTLRGTPFIFQGEELGMIHNPLLQEIGDFKDQQSLSYYQLMVEERGEDKEKIMQRIRRQSRDHARTPLPWNESDQGGFTTGQPWLPVHPKHQELHTELQTQDPHSVLNYYKSIIRLRKEHETLVYGDFKWVLEDHRQILAYMRWMEDEAWLVLLNFTGEEAGYELSCAEVAWAEQAVFVIGSYRDHSDCTTGLERNGRLLPYEAVVYRASGMRE
ncbi:alpha amylase catalytic subunit [Paenibacillus algicola]|uniref:Alpha amylase catalytic subunit n=1 Tax=Paenibacillus algicola TaxID=2565926 RepID=A0A4P8XJY5_9BACL|nr:alpha-glucosidase [Paenibacillus algicola]QCT02613.1 alpha amylase catalytic subunit [Paenibacillus algicola]